jgi:RNA polymerase sigma-70 factor (ECF subfamily)
MIEDETVSDESLLARIAIGDVEALGALFNRRQQNVFRFALHLTGSPAIADDVTQDVFLAVIRDAGRFEPGRAAVGAWLCGIARNFVRRRLGVPREIASIDDEAFDGPMPVVTSDPLTDLTSGEELEALRRAVLSLPLKYREVIVLCDLQEMTYEDAAASLTCAVGTVRSRLHRARALLTSKMQTVQKERERARGVMRRFIA